MKKTYYILFYLNIYTAFLNLTNAQKLQLTIEAENNSSKKAIDSLNTNFIFNDFISLKKGIDTLHYTLEKIGYLENELLSLQQKNDTNYVASYFVGNKYRSITIYYSENDFKKKELLQISDHVTDTYFTLPFATIETALQTLNIVKTSKGNSFARIHLENILKTNNNTLRATLKLTNGDKRTIDDIIIKGYKKFPKSFVKHYAGIKKGNTFDKQDINSQSDALNALGFVSNNKAPEVLFKKDATIVYLYLKKQKNNLFDGILGFSTSEDSKKLTFNGYLNLELNNNLNFGEQFSLNYKSDGNDQQNFRVKVSLPYLLKSPFGLGLELKIFKRDSTFTTTDQQASISYQINPSSKSYIGYKSYESSNLRNDNNEELEVEDYKSKFFLAGLSFTKTQKSKLFPIKTKIRVDTEIGSRNSKDSNELQIKGSTLVHFIFNLNFKNSIFLRNKTRILKSDTFLTNELFRFGGINSIRGFNENSIDASFYSVLNTEYRYQFNQNTFLHSIIDVAYFENNVISLKQKLYSFGIGIGLQTRAGIVNFGIANGNAENQDFNISNTKIHISISSIF